MNPSASIALDDSGQRVLSAGFDFDSLDAEADGVLCAADEARLRREVTLRLIQFLAGRKASAKQAGQRVLILSFLLHVSDCKTQRALAKRLGVTPARVCQALNEAKREFAMLATG